MTGTTITRFSTLVDMQEAHDALLERRDALGDAPATDAAGDRTFWDDVAAFVRSGQAAGALLDLGRERRIAQSLLDFWANALHRAGHAAPDSRLAGFDPDLAPELPDEPCPYQGLAAFDAAKHEFFFGRERLVETLLGRLAAGERLLAVVGASGSGKSSLILGGLLPELAQGALPGSKGWRVIILTPGSQPLDNLAQALLPPAETTETLDLNTQARLLFAAEGFARDPDTLADLLAATGDAPALVVVDQFEELFTLCDDERARRTFVRQLLGLVAAPAQPADLSHLEALVGEEIAPPPPALHAPHRVILTMRTDFVENVEKLPALSPHFRRGRVDVDALDINELRAAIEQPAARAGLRFEEGIVDDLISAILGERAGLPLLQFTLLRLWQKRRRNRIPRSVYHEVGNPRQALERSAEALYKDLIPEEQHTMRRILLRLVRPGEGGSEFTSSRLPVVQLLAGGEAGDRIVRVLERLAGAGLLKVTGVTNAAGTWQGDPANVAPDVQVEVAHEALVRNWPRLVGWLDDERERLRARFRLRQAAEQWAALGKDPNALWRGHLLEEAARSAGLSELEQQFVAAGQDAAQAEAAAAEAARTRELELARQQAELETHRARLYRWAAIVASLLLLLALTLTLYAVDRRAAAEENAVAAATAAAQAQAARALAAAEATAAGQARATADANAALAQAAQATAQAEAERARNAEDIAQSRGLAASAQFIGSANPLRALLLAIEALNVADTGEAATAVEEQAARVARPRLHLDHDAPVRGAAWNDDESRILSWGDDNTARVWEADSGQLRYTLAHSDTVRSAAWSEDGSRILSWGDDNTARVWEADSGDLLHTLPHDSGVNGAAWNGDGSYILSWSDDNTAQVWDTASGELRHTLPHSGTIQGAVWSGDNSRILSWDADDTVRLWEAESGDLLHALYHFLVRGAVWDGGTSRILSWGESGAQVWDAESGESLRLQYVPGVSSIDGAAWNSEGDRILAWAYDAILMWDAESGEWRHTLEQEHRVDGAAWNRDADRILSWGAGGVVAVWDTESGERIHTLTHDRQVTGAAWSDDERYILSWSADNTVRLWDAASGDALLVLPHDDIVWGAAWNEEESRILSWDDDGALRVWDAAGDQLPPTFSHGEWVDGALWNGDERRILSWSDDGALRVWDADSSELRHTLVRDGPVSGALWRGDGSLILSWDDDGALQVWDADSGELLHTLVQDGPVGGVAWSNDASRILSWSEDNYRLFQVEDNALRVWDAASGELLHTLQHDDRVYGATWSGDGSRILSWSGDNAARLWDAASGDPLRILPHNSTVNGATWNGDESRILSWGQNAVRVWDARSGDPPLIQYHDDAILGAAWSNDERRILSWSAGRILVWDAASGDPLRALTHEGDVGGAAWSDDDSRILSWGRDNAIRVWDAASGELRYTLIQDADLYGAVWHADDSRILSRGGDGAIRMWDAETGLLIRAFSGDGSYITSASLSQDESQLMFTAGGKIFRHYTRRDDLLAAACQRATRNLTWQEWQQYLPGEDYRQTCPALPVHPSVDGS